MVHSPSYSTNLGRHREIPIDETPYNPLDKQNLGASVAEAILSRPVSPLPPSMSFNGAGVYAIYYTGDHESYRMVAAENRDGKYAWPIYVGKAISKGARKGGLGLAEKVGPDLFKRLVEHAESIRQARNLRLEDFVCRRLVVDDIWIPLGESLLVRRFRPVWNLYVDGFGNHDPGGGRYQQKRSPWDVLHPGRPWAERCAANEKSVEQIQAALAQAITYHFGGV